MKIVSNFRPGLIAYVVICASFLCAVSVMASDLNTKTFYDMSDISLSESLMSAI